MDRSQIPISSPGSLASAITIAVAPWCMYGIGNPSNVGDCPLSMGGLDERGRILQPHIWLNPGESKSWWGPPEGSSRLVVCAYSNHTGTAILEYDTPYA